MKSCHTTLHVFLILGLLLPLTASAVTIDWSPVGDAGNAADPATGSLYGSVPYDYNIGTYDVTNAQYVAFLNSNVPGGETADPLALYNSPMSGPTYGGINYNSGAPEGNKYSVNSGKGDNPVNYVTWYDAIRFANWLDNGQVAGSTETGAYKLLGGTPTPSNGLDITRNAGATVFLPSEDEWYKAAYYNPTTHSYYQYPTSSNTAPTGSGPTSAPNSASFIPGGPNQLTAVGAYSGTTSPYGAYDMGGNVFQWNEAVYGTYRDVRGGAFPYFLADLQSSYRQNDYPFNEDFRYGFRVASAPEPGTGVLAAIGLVTLSALRKRIGRRVRVSGETVRSTMGRNSIAAVSVGQASMCARSSNGSLWSWGPSNVALAAIGLVGLAAVRRRRLLPLVCLLVTVAMMAPFPVHADIVYTWGDNERGQLGYSTPDFQSATPGAVPGLAGGVTAVAGGNFHSLAIQNGAAYAWGSNDSGQLGNPMMDYDPHFAPAPVTGLSSGVTAVAGGGEDFSLAIVNGGVYAWGYLGDVAGNGGGPTPVPVPGLTSGVTAIATGNAHSFAIQNGALLGWGGNFNGEVGNGTSGFGDILPPVPVTGMTSGVTSIAAGQSHSLAVQNGAAFAWGGNSFGQLGDGTTIQHTIPVPISGLDSNVTAVAAGASFSLALRDGHVYAWGYNNYGQIGDNGSTTTLHSTPELIDPTNLHNIIAIAAASGSSYALSSDGSLWDWGDNQAGQLGLGNFQSKYLLPQHLLPPSGYRFTSISANVESLHAMATLALAGDANSDGIVNGQDIGIIAGHWLNTGLSRPGDTNGDGIVNSQDIGLIASNWLHSIGGGAGSGGSAVPEPGTIISLFLGFAGLLAQRSWRR